MRITRQGNMNTTVVAAKLAYVRINEALAALGQAGIGEEDYYFGEGIHLSDLTKQAEESLIRVACEVKRLGDKAREALNVHDKERR